MSIQRLLAAAGLCLLGGCVNSHLGGGSNARLYHWDDRVTPVAERSGQISTEHGGYFDGDLNFVELLIERPALNTDPATPYLLEACEGSLCYQAVLFPGDFSLNGKGQIKGYATLSALSSVLYREVENLGSAQVKPRLDDLAAQLLRADDKAPRDYSRFIGLDTLRLDGHREQLMDQDLENRTNDLWQAGQRPALAQLLSASVQSTGDLAVPDDFLFSSSWTLDIDVDVSERFPGRSYLVICNRFEVQGNTVDVDYDNCQLKTPLRNGIHSAQLQMSAATTALLAMVISLDSPEQRWHQQWQRSIDGNTLRLR
jgi:hypothetical protein